MSAELKVGLVLFIVGIFVLAIGVSGTFSFVQALIGGIVTFVGGATLVAAARSRSRGR